MQYELKIDEDLDIQVGAHTVHIKLVDGSHFEDNHHGLWVQEKYTIFISKNDPYSMRLSTLIHELIHVFEDFYSIKISHKDLNLVGDMLAQVLLTNFKVESPRKKRKS